LRLALAATRAAHARAKSRAEALERKVRRFRRRLATVATANLHLKDLLARRTLSASVVEQTVAVRLAALRRSSRADAARAIEEDFAVRSCAYRETRDLGERRAETCERIQATHGLQWWIPRQVARDGNSLEASVASGWLPFAAILSTRELAQGAIMLDIGANVGTTSIPRVVLGDFQRVYAAEPEPSNYASLCQNVIANGLAGFVMPDRVAIGSHDGELTMDVAPNIGAHRVIGEGTLGPAPGRVIVPSRTLDSWVEGLGIEPALVAFVKCDVQGWETRVLKGASSLLQQRQIVWQIEVSPKHLSEAGTSLRELCCTLRHSFDRFIDLEGYGQRGRPTSELETALDYLGEERRFTDLLVYST
jgi:FkbM family methyltransferase